MMMYVLTDGSEIFERREMDADEYCDAQEKAIPASGGNLYWVLEEDYYDELDPIEDFGYFGYEGLMED